MKFLKVFTKSLKYFKHIFINMATVEEFVIVVVESGATASYFRLFQVFMNNLFDY